MPEICRFLGIVVYMNFRDHAPPHFHARYGGSEVTVRIEPAIVLDGQLPPRVVGLVVEWATLNRSELLENWRRAREGRRLKRLAPLQ